MASSAGGGLRSAGRCGNATRYRCGRRPQASGGGERSEPRERGGASFPRGRRRVRRLTGRPGRRDRGDGCAGCEARRRPGPGRRGERPQNQNLRNGGRPRRATAAPGVRLERRPGTTGATGPGRRAAPGVRLDAGLDRGDGASVHKIKISGTADGHDGRRLRRV